MAKQVYTEVDNSLSVAQAGAMKAGIVVVSSKGKVDTGVTLETESDLIRLYGKPDYKKSSTMYSALSFLQKSSGLIVARAIHTTAEGVVESDADRTARYSASLVRGKVSALPEGIPDASFQPDRVVEPYKTSDGYGLRQADIDSFSFPVYARSRTYKKLDNKVLDSNQDQANIIYLDKRENLKVGSKISFGNTVGDDSPYYTITAISDFIHKYDTAKFDMPITADKGATARRVTISKEELSNQTNSQATQGQSSVTLDTVDGLESGQTISFGENNNQYVIQSVSADTKTITIRETFRTQIEANTKIVLYKRDYSNYPAEQTPTILRSVSGSDTIMVSNADLLGEGDIITFMPGLTNSETEFKVIDKNLYSEDQTEVTLDKDVSVSQATIIQLMTNSEFENRDVLLVYAYSQGEHGNDTTISIEKSVDYPDTARIIRVFNKGVDTGEKFEVTFEEFVDGLGKQLYVESVINGKSEYIMVKHNTDMVDDNGTPILPLLNDYSVWREAPSDLFENTGVKTAESLLEGETDVRVSRNDDFNLGDRIKFGSYPQEYKVTGKSSVGTEFHITIDRPIQVEKINVSTNILKFKELEYKKVSKIDKQYPDYKPNQIMTISGKQGYILDCGTNCFDGGTCGTSPDVGDIIQCLNKVFSNRNEITVNMILSGGIYSPSYAQAIDTLCQKREDCYGYLSNDLQALDVNDAVKATKEFRSSLNINSRWSSLFADWGIAYDPYNKLMVTVPLDGIAAALQSFAAEGGLWGVPVAGWQSGATFYIQKLYKTWTEDEREELLNYQINPIKADKTRGLSIWGNKTLYGSRSFMQARNVAFILIQMRIETRDYMEGQHWQVNDSAQRAIMVNTLLDSFQKFMPVLNDLQIKDQTTAVDEDANQIKIYIGIQPKGLVENIFVTLGVFSNTQGITIS